MQVISGWRDVPASARGAALAIGNFDGVHRGHQAVLRRAQERASQSGEKAGALIFEPHPRQYFAPEKPFFRLTPLDVKLELLQSMGLDETIVIPFDADLANLSAETFACDVIAGGLGASHVVVGHDFTFGKGRTGSTEDLIRFGRQYGFSVDVVEPVMAGAAPFSSSAIRAHLRQGQVADAATLLGYWWRVRGTVQPGAGRGKDLGFPTLNLALAPGQELAHGIYAVRVVHGGRSYDAAGYLGARPTFDAGAPALEAYLFDFDDNLYGASVEIEFVAFIRPDQKFDSGEALAAQMQQDCAAITAILAKTPSNVPTSGS